MEVGHTLVRLAMSKTVFSGVFSAKISRRPSGKMNPATALLKILSDSALLSRPSNVSFSNFMYRNIA